MLADFNVRPGTAGSSAPGAFVAANFELYFAATTPLVGRELWVADRTRGARLLVDLVPGTAGGNPTAITAWGDRLAFLADLGQGQQIYSVDLASRVVSPLVGASQPLRSVSRLTVSGTRLFFVADDGTNGAELWIAPVAGGPAQPLADLRPGADAQFAAMAPFRNGVAMVVDDGTHGFELWVSDGTTGGTRLVRDLNPGSASGATPTQPTAFGNVLYFAGDDGATGSELFAFDGTNVRLVADLIPGVSGSGPQMLTVAANQLAFLADDGANNRRRPAVSNGTAAGTQFVSGVGSVANLVSDGGGRLFALTEAPSDLVVIDAGASSARRLGLSFTYDRPLTPRIASAGSRVYFEAIDAATRRTQVWSSDGTATGTVRVSEPSSRGVEFAAGFADGAMLFAQATEEHGRELWLSNGTASGTQLFADLDPSRATQDSSPSALGEVGGRTVLQLQDGSLVATNGAVRGTGLVYPAGLGTSWLALGELNDTLLLFASDTSARLVGTDGTPGGTVVLANVSQNFSAASPPGALLDGTRAVFAGESNRVAGQLWVTDGTPAGTRMLRNFDPSGRVPPYGFARVGREVWFFGYDGTSLVELWATDGTVAGTRLLTAVPQSTSSPPRVFGVVNDKLLFATFDAQSEYETWVSDGTPSGTQLLVDLTPFGSTNFRAGESVVIGNRMLIPTNLGMLSTDGTPAGSILLRGTRGDEEIVGMGEIAYLLRSAAPAVFLRTDGTVAGTNPTSVTLPVGARALRRINDHSFAIGVLGSQGAPGLLLVSDGTASGTRVVNDNYYPGRIGLVDGGVVYAGADARHGVEPWITDLGATAHAVGLGCALGQLPALRASEPRLGQQMTVRVTPPGTGSALLLGPAAFTPLRLPLPIRGCSLFVGELAAILSFPGTGELHVPVPFGFDLVGLRLAAQSIGLDNSLALTLSNGVRLTLGM